MLKYTNLKCTVHTSMADTFAKGENDLIVSAITTIQHCPISIH